MNVKYNIYAIRLSETDVKTKGIIADRIENVSGSAAGNKAAKKLAQAVLDEHNKKLKTPLKFNDAWTEFVNAGDGRFGFNPKKNSGIEYIIRAIPVTFKIKI